MGLLDVCSYNSYWRGLDYFENKRVKSLKQINRYEFEADVEGTETYHVHLAKTIIPLHCDRFN